MRKVISQFGEGSLQQKLNVGDLHFVADLEVAGGGSNTGPTPSEYLAAALASCTSMTLKMYSEHKALNLENAIVAVDIARVDGIEKFTRDIQLVGALTAEQSERLLDIANKCPLYKALSGEIQIKTQLVN